MAIENKFKKSIIITLAKRAANRCSNPDCGAITSGPSNNPNDSVNVGEAAHIYGANLGSARYDADMITTDRNAISNAIWLCGNCHKLIDDDPVKYPAGLLFEWQREHEFRISEQVGKIAAEIRQRYEKRHLEEFGRLSYLAERLIIEKSDYWEYLLTAEMLRHEMTPVIQRWSALKRGLYVKPTTPINDADFMPWLLDRLHEIQNITNAFDEIINIEFSRAWGAPNIAGSDTDIINTSRLFTEMCESTLAWEEMVRFARVGEIFSEAHSLLIGIAGGLIEHSAKVPKFLMDTIADSPTSGIFELQLTITLPDGWSDKLNEAIKRALHAQAEHL